LVLVEEKVELMRKLGKKRLTLDLATPLATVPDELRPYRLELTDAGTRLLYNYDTKAERTGITALLADLAKSGIRFRDLETKQTSLEEIFVSLVTAK
jgi:ABC-2 type transport system ATP-binding protein